MNSCTKFAMNLINIYGVMNVYLCKKIKVLFMHGYRVNCLWGVYVD